MFQYLDKDFYFNYGEFEVLDFTEGQFSSNLTSTIAYYAYVVLGMDYDSFSELGEKNTLTKLWILLMLYQEELPKDGPCKKEIEIDTG